MGQPIEFHRRPQTGPRTTNQRRRHTGCHSNPWVERGQFRYCRRAAYGLVVRYERPTGDKKSHREYSLLHRRSRFPLKSASIVGGTRRASEIYREANSRYIAISTAYGDVIWVAPSKKPFKKVGEQVNSARGITSTGRASTRAKSVRRTPGDCPAAHDLGIFVILLYDVWLGQMGRAPPRQRGYGPSVDWLLSC